MVKQLEESYLVSMEMSYLRQSKTLELSAQVRKELVTQASNSHIKGQNSTESFQVSWPKVVTLLQEMEEEENLFTVLNSKMRISNSDTQSHISYQWQMLDQVPMALNSSSHSKKLPG